MTDATTPASTAPTAQGRELLTAKDFVTVYGPDGATMQVPKHWAELPPGFSKTKPKDETKS